MSHNKERVVFIEGKVYATVETPDDALFGDEIGISFIDEEDSVHTVTDANGNWLQYFQKIED